MCTIIYTDCDDHAKPGIWALRIKTHVWLSTHDTYWTWRAQNRSCRPVLTRSNGNLARVRTRRVVVDKWADGQPVQNLKTCQTIVQQPTPEPTQSTNWIDDAMTKTLARLSLYCIVFGASGNKQRASGNRQRASGNKQRASGNKQRASGNKPRASGNKQRASGQQTESERAANSCRRQRGEGNTWKSLTANSPLPTRCRTPRSNIDCEMESYLVNNILTCAYALQANKTGGQWNSKRERQAGVAKEKWSFLAEVDRTEDCATELNNDCQMGILFSE